KRGRARPPPHRHHARQIAGIVVTCGKMPGPTRDGRGRLVRRRGELVRLARGDVVGNGAERAGVEAVGVVRGLGRVAEPIVLERLPERALPEGDRRGRRGAFVVRIATRVIGVEGRGPRIRTGGVLVVDFGYPVEVVVLDLARDRLGAAGPFAR